MGIKANGTWVIDTLGDLIASGCGLTATCGNHRNCGRTLDLDVYDLALQFGKTAKHSGRRFPIRCSSCGSRELHFIMSPDSRPKHTAQAGRPTNFRQSRPEVERRALEALFPRRWDWSAGDP